MARRKVQEVKVKYVGARVDYRVIDPGVFGVLTEAPPLVWSKENDFTLSVTPTLPLMKYFESDPDFQVLG